MRITNMKTNDMVRPLGFLMDAPEFSWLAQSSGRRQTAYRVTVRAGGRTVFDSGRTESSEMRCRARFLLKPRTRYEWKVALEADDGDRGESDFEWFESGAETLRADWISPDVSPRAHPIFFKDFTVEKETEARLYCTGVGLFVPLLDGARISGERLTPGCSDYRAGVQVFAYAVKLLPGLHRLEIATGNGWYKGRFAGRENIFGDEFAAIAELSAGDELLASTGKDWMWRESAVLSDGIYDGESVDFGRRAGPPRQVRIARSVPPFSGRLSVPIEAEYFGVPRLIVTPNGERVLDAGQNLAGFIRFSAAVAAGRAVSVEYGELLGPDGNFYRDNLRTARQIFSVTGDGTFRVCEPRFSYYGFRYARIKGFGEDLPDFEVYALHSSMERTGDFTSSNALLNRFYENTVWGQLSNFVDIPTDCPQRDERFGWTGDAQIFAETALLHFDCAAFFRKYLRDIDIETDKWGAPPDFAPSFMDRGEDFPLYASSGWADAIAVIPEALYRRTGSEGVLESQFPYLAKWVRYMRARDENGLFTAGCRYGEWLALDGEDGVHGATDPILISTAYYYRSARTAARFAERLGRTADCAEFAEIAARAREAWRKTYMQDGKLTDGTQTGHAVALAFGLTDEGERGKTAAELVRLIDEREGAMTTGFLGTPVLLFALGDNGYPDRALELLLRESAPGWLYPVTRGATTVWERWDGLAHLADGGMNSFNHYQGGAVAAWIYRRLCGLDSSEKGDIVNFNPVLSAMLPRFCGSVPTPRGIFHMNAEYAEGIFRVTLEVPFNACARHDGKIYGAGVHLLEIEAGERKKEKM